MLKITERLVGGILVILSLCTAAEFWIYEAAIPIGPNFAWLMAGLMGVVEFILLAGFVSLESEKHR